MQFILPFLMIRKATSINDGLNQPYIQSSSCWGTGTSGMPSCPTMVCSAMGVVLVSSSENEYHHWKPYITPCIHHKQCQKGNGDNFHNPPAMKTTLLLHSFHVPVFASAAASATTQIQPHKTTLLMNHYTQQKVTTNFVLSLHVPLHELGERDS